MSFQEKTYAHNTQKILYIQEIPGFPRRAFFITIPSNNQGGGIASWQYRRTPPKTIHLSRIAEGLSPWPTSMPTPISPQCIPPSPPAASPSITGAAERHRPCGRQALRRPGPEGRASPTSTRQALERRAPPRSRRGRPGRGRRPAPSPTDVSRFEDLLRLQGRRLRGVRRGRRADEQCRASAPGGKPWEHYEGWKRAAGRQSVGRHQRRAGLRAGACSPQGTPAAIVNTGSKQGITTPPGNTAYNVSKAGVKVLTEALAHELRNTPGCQVTRAPADPGLHLHRHDRRRRARSRPAPGRRTRCRLHAGRAGARRLLHPVPRQRRRPRDSTSGACRGPPATSSRTGRRCRAGTPTTRTPSMPSAATDNHPPRLKTAASITRGCCLFSGLLDTRATRVQLDADSCSKLLKTINFSALNRFRLNAG